MNPSDSLAIDASTELPATINPVVEAPPVRSDREEATAAAKAGFRSGLALFDQAVVSGTRFLTTILVGRVCGPDDLGIYTLAFAPVMMIACAQEALLTQPYTVYGNRVRGRRRATLAGSVLAHYSVIALLVMIVLGVAAAATSVGFGQQRFASLLLALALVIPCTLLWEFGRRMAYAHLKLTSAVVMDVAIAAVQLGGIVLLAWLGYLTATTAYITIGIACGSVGLAWLFVRRRDFNIQRRFILRDWKTNWSLGKWLAACQLSGAVHGHSMNWALAIMVGTLATGVFAACESIVLLSNPIIHGVGNLLGAETARAYAQGGVSNVGRITGRAALLMTIAMALLCGFLLISSERLIALFYGDAFQGQRSVLTVLTLCPMAWGISTVVAKGLLAIERPDVNFRATLFGFVATLVVASPLISSAETLGAAWALLIGSFAAATWQGIAFIRLIRNARQDASDRRRSITA